MLLFVTLMLGAMVAAVVAIMAGAECDCCDGECEIPKSPEPPEPEKAPVVGFEHLHVDHKFDVLDEHVVPEVPHE